MTRLLALLASLAMYQPAMAEEATVETMTSTIALQTQTVASIRNYRDDACYNPDFDRPFGITPKQACVEAGVDLDVQMGHLNSLLGAKEAIVLQAAIQAQINQVDLMRRKYNETCLSDESLQAEQGDRNNDVCRFVRAEYETAVDDLTRLMHGEAPIVCTGDDCPAAVADESN